MRLFLSAVATACLWLTLASSGRAACVPSGISSATLKWTGDHYVTMFVNGTQVDYRAPAYSSIWTVDVSAYVLLSGLNVISAEITDDANSKNGASWELSIVTNCGTQVVMSDGTCTTTLYRGYDGNYQANPVGWMDDAYDDSWWGPANFPTDYPSSNWKCVSDGSAISVACPVPWTYGASSFQTLNTGERYLMRQKFSLEGSGCPPPPTRTASPTVSPTPTCGGVNGSQTLCPSAYVGVPWDGVTRNPFATVGSAGELCNNSGSSTAGQASAGNYSVAVWDAADGVANGGITGVTAYVRWQGTKAGTTLTFDYSVDGTNVGELSPNQVFSAAAADTYQVNSLALSSTSWDWAKLNNLRFMLWNNSGGGGGTMTVDYVWFVVSTSGASCGTPSFTATASPTQTPTATPAFPFVKSANLSQATLGDTITYCVAWTNDSAANASTTIWDTLSSYITYIGCDNGCSKIGPVVSWNVADLGAGLTATRCFWATVNGYPWWPEGLQMMATVRQRQWRPPCVFP